MIHVAVTDAHTLIWYGLRRFRKIGAAARKVLERADTGRAAVYVPTIALVEIAEAVYRGRIDIADGFATWADRLFSTHQFIPAELTLDVVLRAEELYAVPERGDRLIAATALDLGYPLLTRDPNLHRVPGLETVW
ncbi:MAG: PIN domain-containing protein [Luteitalea sp.]|nr:PIN domain-containing protein [Luteitalea sp.]